MTAAGPVHAARRLRAWELGHTSERCFECDTVLVHDVYRLRINIGVRFFGSNGYLVLPHCEGCALATISARPWRYPHGDDMPSPYPCEVCSRTVIQSELRRRLPACSPRCARELEADRRRARRGAEKAARKVSCDECGKDFTPERDDAVYCPGGACKQRAYRRRKRAEKDDVRT